MLSFKPTFSLSTFTFIKRLFTRRGTATPVHRPHRPAGSTHSSTQTQGPRILADPDAASQECLGEYVTLFYHSFEEELKSLLMKVKVESERVGLKRNIQKTKIRSPVPSTPERREGLRACYWEGPSELPERRSSSSAPRRGSAEPRPRGCSGLGEPRPALPSF